MDQQLGEVWPTPFALASAKLDVQHHVIWGVHLTNISACQCVKDGVAPIRKIYLLGLWGAGVAPPLRVLPASVEKSRARRLAANWGEVWWKHGQTDQAWPCLVCLVCTWCLLSVQNLRVQTLWLDLRLQMILTPAEQMEKGEALRDVPILPSGCCFHQCNGILALLFLLLLITLPYGPLS